MTKHPKRSHDPNQLANLIVDLANGEKTKPLPTPRDESGKDRAAVALGRRGGLKGGASSAAKSTPDQRKNIARKSVLTRWKD